MVLFSLPKAGAGHDDTMTNNGEDLPLHYSSQAFDRGDSAATDSRPFGTSLEAGTTCKEKSSALKVSACKAEGDVSPYQPRPPPQPRRPKPGKSNSAEDTVRTRRLRSSQESLSDPTETGSSSDSLRDDPTAAASSGPCSGGCAGVRNLQDSNGRSLAALPTGSRLVFRDRGSSLSEYERRPRSQQSDGAEHRVRSAKVRLSPVRHVGTLPALEMNFASASLRAANRIDKDCLDYAAVGREREKLHRNLSDSRLLESMGSDCASVSSLRSTYSVLSPIRPQDVRNRYSQHIRSGISHFLPSRLGLSHIAAS